MRTLSSIILFVSLLIATTNNLAARSLVRGMILSGTGDIKGKVVDENKKPIAYANVVVMGAGAGTMTGEDGSFMIHNINPGTYDVKASFLLKQTITRTGVVVKVNEISYVNFTLINVKNDTLVIVGHKQEPWMAPVVSIDYSTYNSISQELFSELGAQSMNDKIMNVCSSCSMSSDNQLVMRGARSGSVEYIVDGERLLGNAQPPNEGVEQVTVLSGGIPAEYGDMTGGVIIISTKDYVSGAYESRVMRNKILYNAGNN
ncbi:MAG: carboxypeptidase regulatory-like domain-containing protein [Bacteroidia bacterium]